MIQRWPILRALCIVSPGLTHLDGLSSEIVSAQVPCTLVPACSAAAYRISSFPVNRIFSNFRPAQKMCFTWAPGVGGSIHQPESRMS